MTTRIPHPSYRRQPGLIECPGVYMGNHTDKRYEPGQGQVAKCRYCKFTLRTTSYGRSLRQHFVAEGRCNAALRGPLGYTSCGIKTYDGAAHDGPHHGAY